MGKKGKRKNPASEFSPSDSKLPRGGGKADRVPSEKFAWRSDKIVFDGVWGWEKVSIKVAMSELIPKLHAFETMTWSEIEGGTGSHFVAIDGLCKAAQDRLEELGHLDLDDLFSLRMTGRRRIWGIRDKAMLRILWWDPDHEVCPSHKKHT